MNDKNFEKLQELKFRKITTSWIGKVDGYFFTVADKQDSENELIIYISLAPNPNKNKLFEYFDGLQANNEISNYSMEKNMVSLIYFEDKGDNIEDFLKKLAEKIKEIDGKNVCNNCDSTDGLSYYTNGNVYSLLCSKCGNDLMEKFETDKNMENNYIKGFFASLIGALIGSAIWIIIGALGFFASIAGLAISYCAFKGYSIAKGKFTRKGIILNVIAIIIAFLFAQYAVLFIEFMKEYDNMTLLGFLAITPLLFSSLEFIKALLPNIGLGLLFIVLGSYKTIVNNYKSAKNQENMEIERLNF